ncbi:MAG: amidase [Dehalococcoidia bacterium]
MTQPDLMDLTIADASARIDAGELSPVALTEAAFARIDATDATLNAFVRLMRGSALAEAEAAEQRARTRRRRSALDGIPVAVKDIFDTAGVVTSAGTAAFRERVPVEDATAVTRLREAGAAVIGKTNTHELALGGTTYNVHYGPTHNPWAPDHVPGGSSGGSAAAVAAGLGLGALGTDTGGSVRIPAAFCGITGHKPTYGLVGRGGVVPLALTLDHVGPMARTAFDCALMLEVLAGYDPRDHDSVSRPPERFAEQLEGGIAGMSLAVVPSLVEGVSAEVRARFGEALDVLAGLGARISEVEPMAGVDDWRERMLPLIPVEGATNVEDILRHRPHQIGEPVRTRMASGLEFSAQAYVRALRMRQEIEARFERTLGPGRGLDAIVLPTALDTAEPIGPDATVETPPARKFRNTNVFDYSHQPSVSVPCGSDGQGLPVGLMISTAKWRDALALRIAHAYQDATDFHARRPPAAR